MNPKLRKNLTGFMETEFTGIDSKGVYLPKSFSHLEGDDLAFALKGIYKTWHSLNPEKGILETDSAKFIKKGNDQFYDFIFLNWLKTINNLIRMHLAPVFCERSIQSNYLLGKTNFLKFETENYKTDIKFSSSYTELTFETLYLTLLKDGFEAVLKNYTLNSSSPLTVEIVAEANIGLHTLRAAKKSSEPLSTAYEVKSRYANNNFMGLHSKLEPLVPAISFFSKYIIERHSGVESGISNISGLIFNLNYLLELILQKALKSLYETCDTTESKNFEQGKINQISTQSINSELKFKSMRPDCFGVFKKFHAFTPEYIDIFFREKIYIMDAKHKFYWNENQPNSIKREDFYQLVSYATTHSNPDDRDGIYALVGLQNERLLEENFEARVDRYVDLKENNKSTRIMIDFDEKSLRLFQVPIKLGQFLFDIGNSKTNGESLERFQVLGLGICEAIYQLSSPK